MNDEQELGRRIGSLREAAGMTQQQLADAAAVPVSTLRNWEQGHREPMASAVVRLAAALGVTTDAVLGTGASDDKKPAEQPARPRGRPRKAAPAEPNVKPAGKVRKKKGG